jgi:hypothetical protein
MYLWLVNTLGRWLPPVLAFVLPAGLVLGLGVVFAYKSGRPLLDKTDLKSGLTGWSGLA